jgi:hypothetical protein
MLSNSNSAMEETSMHDAQWSSVESRTYYAHFRTKTSQTNRDLASKRSNTPNRLQKWHSAVTPHSSHAYAHKPVQPCTASSACAIWARGPQSSRDSTTSPSRATPLCNTPAYAVSTSIQSDQTSRRRSRMVESSPSTSPTQKASPWSSAQSHTAGAARPHISFAGCSKGSTTVCDGKGAGLTRLCR